MEGVRLQTLGRTGLQQLQLDVQYLQPHLTRQFTLQILLLLICLCISYQALLVQDCWAVSRRRAAYATG